MVVPWVVLKAVPMEAKKAGLKDAQMADLLVLPRSGAVTVGPRVAAKVASRAETWVGE